MVLVLFLLALTFVPSWQEAMTEKNLNQMLDQLIEETVLPTYSKEKENNSRIIYLTQDNVTRHNYDSRLNTVLSSEYQDLEELVQQIEDSNHNINTHQNHLNSEAGHDVTVQIERSGHYHSNDGDIIQDTDITNNEISKSSRPFEERQNKIIVMASDPESNLIHKYPEIIIDKISYDVADNINEPNVETAVHHSTVKHLTNEEKKEVAAKALHSLMRMIMQGAQMRKKLDLSKDKEPEDMSNVQRSTHIHNDYHNHVINNVPLPYSDLLPREKMSLGKLSDGYRDLHRIINRPRSAYLDPNLHLSRWGGSAGQTPLMSISRTHNRNHVHFIPESLNILPRIVYGSLFRRQYPG